MRWLFTCSGLDEGVSRYTLWAMTEGILPTLASPYAWTPEAVADHEALLLTGGGDAQPSRYGMALHPCTQNISEARDEMELALIRAFLAAGKPVLGICRGLQMIAVACGGRLIQHLPDVAAAAGVAEEHGKLGPRDARHGVRWTAGTRMGSALGTVTEVNSAHHQAADPAAPGAGLVITAVSPGGVVEALEDPARRIAAVQGHPERFDPPAAPAAHGVLKYFQSLCG